MTQHSGPLNGVTLIWSCHTSAVRSAEETVTGESTAPVWWTPHIAVQIDPLVKIPPIAVTQTNTDSCLFIECLRLIPIHLCVCLCVFCRGICGVICLSRIGCSETLSCCSCRGWPVKLLPASLTFTNTTSCTGSTSESQGLSKAHSFLFFLGPLSWALCFS